MSDILETLRFLAALPPETCGPCGRGTAHTRCSECGECSEGEHYGKCPVCSASGNRYRSPVYMWEPRPRFAATFAADLLSRAARYRGPLRLSPKQEALVLRLASEARQGPTSTAQKPALEWIGPRSKGWRAIRAAAEACQAFQLVAPLRAEEPADVALIRSTLGAIIAERTGYEALSTAEEYADALRAIHPKKDKALAKALITLCDMHVWLIRERRAVEPVKNASHAAE